MSFGCAFPVGVPPSLDGFVAFVRALGISTGALPDGSPAFAAAYSWAIDTVNPALAVSPGVPTQPSVYATAVYDLATHVLIETAPDVSTPIARATWANGLATFTLVPATTLPVMPGDAVAVAEVSPVAYDANPSKPFVANSVDPGVNLVSVAIQPNPGPAIVLAGAAMSSTYFYRARSTYGINRFAPGVVTSTGDQGTNVGLLNPKFMQNLTLADLQYMKTPWGRAYLSISQKFGSLWGLS
jgi:hypothetical protein